MANLAPPTIRSRISPGCAPDQPHRDRPRRPVGDRRGRANGPPRMTARSTSACRRMPVPDAGHPQPHVPHRARPKLVRQGDRCDDHRLRHHGPSGRRCGRSCWPAEGISAPRSEHGHPQPAGRSRAARRRRNRRHRHGRGGSCPRRPGRRGGRIDRQPPPGAGRTCRLSRLCADRLGRLAVHGIRADTPRHRRRRPPRAGPQT